MEPWKGHRQLLAALERLKAVPGWTCWIAGGAQRPQERIYCQQLQRQVAAAGLESRVQFLGQRSDVDRILAAADIHCQPNEGPEPFGIAFIEALDAGLPVVTVAMGGPVEIVDPTCGVLTPPGDIAALADALRRLIDDPAERRRLGTAGPERARQLCDPTARMQELQRVLEEVAGPTPGAAATRAKARLNAGQDARPIQWESFGAKKGVHSAGMLLHPRPRRREGVTAEKRRPVVVIYGQEQGGST
jgi:glycosyltransferase involved in cell wall biosynthesis